MHVQGCQEYLVGLLRRDRLGREYGHSALYVLVHDDVLARDIGHPLDQGADIGIPHVHDQLAGRHGGNGLAREAENYRRCGQ